MEKILQKNGKGILAQLCSIEVTKIGATKPEKLQPILSKHEGAFEEPIGLPPSCSHNYAIQLVLGSKPQNIQPYRYPYLQKNEIEKLVQEMLDVGVI